MDAVLCYTSDASNTTARQTAEAFARTFFDVERKIRAYDDASNTFCLRGGVAYYEVRFVRGVPRPGGHPPRWEVWRLPPLPPATEKKKRKI